MKPEREESNMKEELRQFVKDRTAELTAAPSCCKEAKEAAAKWLAAAGTPAEKEETARYLQELAEDITPIDGLIAFANSDYAAKEFGPEGAKNLAAHAADIKAKGAKYCDCAACTAALAILNKKEELLG
jgi:hypothetical protein